MSSESSLVGVIFKFFVVVVFGLIVLLGALVLIGKERSDGQEAAGDGGSESGAPVSTHDETLIFKFRELFDQPAPDQSENLGNGITAIRDDRTSGQPIDLYRLLELCGEVDRDVDYLADRTTRVEQAIGWFIVDGRLHYVVLLRPFDRVAHQLMQRSGEDLFVSFQDGQGQLLAPVSAPAQVPTTSLRTVVDGRVPVGWACYGELPYAATQRVDQPKLGWIFSERLHAQLRTMQRSNHKLREGVIDPFGIEVDVQPTAKLGR